jgi:hypothetical protein
MLADIPPLAYLEAALFLFDSLYRTATRSNDCRESQNMRRLTERGSILLFFVIAAASLLLVHVVPVSAAPPKSPDQLISDLLTAAHAGDVNAFLALLTASSRDALTQSYANQASLQHASDAFVQALNARFGESTPVLSDVLDDLKGSIARLAEAQILNQKPLANGDVELRVKTTSKTPLGQAVREQTLVAHREGDGWKLVGGFHNDTALTADELKAAERIAQEVRDGKYPDRQAAMIALSDAWSGKGSK